MNIDAMLDFAVMHVKAENPSERNPKWSDIELTFLRSNAGRMSDQEIGDALGRTANAVKVLRTRLRLLSISTAHTHWLTGRDVSRLLAIDEHKIAGWCRQGLIQHIKSGEQKTWYLISLKTLTAWVVNPDHWVYFDWKKIPDPHLHRLCELRAMRWGDEWWTTAQVAAYHDSTAANINNMAAKGRIPAYQPPFSIGGRHTNRRWKFWFIKRSDAVAAKVVTRDKDMAKKFTKGGDLWIMRAHEVYGYSLSRIARTMGVSVTSVSNRYKLLSGKNPRREQIRGQH